MTSKWEVPAYCSATGMSVPRTGAVRHCELSATALDLQSVVDQLDDSTSGGLAVFVGRVRNHDLGRQVVGLEYVAHPSALQRLREVCARVVDDFEITGVAAVHRVGHLQVGEAAVIVASAAPHRGDAFEATRALIDRLKETVPIWKHQAFVDGRGEWVGSP